MVAQGVLITLEGGDGAGKSTLMQGLYERLLSRGETPLCTRAPGGTSLGEGIRTLLLHQKVLMNPRSELFLFLADRAQHMQEVIFPALAQGKIVLCDRFHDSTLAYQGAARGLDQDIIHSLCLFATEGRIPDLTFYLDLPPEVGLTRITKKGMDKDRIESESLSFHEKIRHSFLQIAEKEPKRVRVLDAMQTPDQILQQAIVHINDIFLSSRQ